MDAFAADTVWWVEVIHRGSGRGVIAFYHSDEPAARAHASLISGHLQAIASMSFVDTTDSRVPG